MVMRMVAMMMMMMMVMMHAVLHILIIRIENHIADMHTVEHIVAIDAHADLLCLHIAV
jgi:hypothetical protein